MAHPLPLASASLSHGATAEIRVSVQLVLEGGDGRAGGPGEGAPRIHYYGWLVDIDGDGGRRDEITFFLAPTNLIPATHRLRTSPAGSQFTRCEDAACPAQRPRRPSDGDGDGDSESKAGRATENESAARPGGIRIHFHHESGVVVAFEGGDGGWCFGHPQR
ncbi:uncharacterized protein DSM5745_07144 [Aspergillus mulundensis]|uniref:Uncharacterized protein n=1 Tax=Aspergillus mulundensis TaxID=1810919 RepID=A0A3D8RKA4_9EURO|nr:hypothetical protein DSM5745_07144 [Aspergillus mulundensis]RDW74482.1 hypothetical protein DSM5745_07144 [Aspergillus mulundensis]